MIFALLCVGCKSVHGLEAPRVGGAANPVQWSPTLCIHMQLLKQYDFAP